MPTSREQALPNKHRKFVGPDIDLEFTATYIMGQDNKIRQETLTCFRETGPWFVRKFSFYDDGGLFLQFMRSGC